MFGLEARCSGPQSSNVQRPPQCIKHRWRPFAAAAAFLLPECPLDHDLNPRGKGQLKAPGVRWTPYSRDAPTNTRGQGVARLHRDHKKHPRYRGRQEGRCKSKTRISKGTLGAEGLKYHLPAV